MVILKTDKNFDVLSWVIKARKIKSETALDCLYIDDLYIVAVDGNRLHRAAVFLTAPGIYDVLSATKQQIIIEKNNDHIYPDYIQIMPDILSRDHILELEHNKTSFARFTLSTGYVINYNFFQDHIFSDAIYQYYLKRDAVKLSSIYYKSGIIDGMLMPLRNNIEDQTAFRKKLDQIKE